MTLSISREGDLTPEQPTNEEQIDLANEKIQEYRDYLDRDEVPMWVVNLLKYIFKEEEKFMDELVARTLEEIQKTELDEKLYKIVADIVKEQIPGTHFEPVIGTALEGIGAELKKPE